MNRTTLALLCLAVVACGVKITPAEISKTLPDDAAERNKFIPTATWKRHLSELAGTIIHEMEPGQPGETWQQSGTRRYLRTGQAPEELSILPDEGLVVEILVDNTADAELSALAFGNTTLSDKEKMSFIYMDTHEVFVPGASIDQAGLTTLNGTAKPTGVKARYFVQGALLSNIQRKTYSEVTGMFKTIDGVGVNVGGKYYGTNSKFSNDYAIHLTLRELSTLTGDLRRLDRFVRGAENAPKRRDLGDAKRVRKALFVRDR